MRETRSRTNRLPLQTIPDQNSEKMRKTSSRLEKMQMKDKSLPASENGSAGRVLANRKGIHPARVKESSADMDMKSLNSLSMACNGHSHMKDCHTQSKTKSSHVKPSSRKRLHSPSSSPEKRPLKIEKVAEAETSSDSEEELDYEELRERNLRDNELFFTSLGIEKAKEDLKLSSKKPASANPYQKRDPRAKEVLPLRQSLRIRRIDPAGQPLPPEPEPVVALENEHPRVPAGPVQMSDAVDLERRGADENHELILKSVTSIDAQSCRFKPHSADLSKFVSEMKKMQITTKAKLCKDRLFSVAIHPSCTKLLAVAGDKWGRLGFWDMDVPEKETVTVYRPHSRPIGHIYMPPSEPHKVYTCSYDSTLRCGHFDTGVFDEIYSVPEEEDDLFRNFDFLSPSTLLLAQFRGNVSVIDVRSPSGKADQSYSVCDKYLRTVSIHPLEKNFFITAGTDMQVAVWDMRKLKAKGNKPLHSLTHGRAVSSAYFSPLTGRHILSCSADDTLNIYDCSSGCGDVTRAKTINHNNKTGRWLTPFRAVWHAAREDVFFVGSMKTPRRMEAFGVDGRLLHEFQGEMQSSVCSVVQFHPSRPVFVGGNSSGYVFPYV